MFKNKKLRCIISGVLLVMMCALIFFFSAQPGEDSAKTSGSFTKKLLLPLLKMLGIDVLNTDFFVTADNIIRKAAHFTEYAVLGALAALFISSFFENKKTIFILSVVFGFLYSCSDEIHQYFVPGRSGMVTDVLLDSGGVIFGAAALILTAAALISRKKPKTNR